MKLKQKLFKLIKECLGIEKKNNSFIEDVINLNNEQGGENGKK
jgi:hypothetical protein